MDRRLIPLLAAVFIIFALLTGSLATAAGARNAEPNPPIRLKTGTFVSGTAGTAAQAQSFSTPRGDEPAVYLVQFGGPVQESWKAEVRAAGGEILDYVPDYAFKVRLTAQQAARVAELENVVWSGPFLPAYKLDPALSSRENELVRLRLEPFAAANEATRQVAAAGAGIVQQDGRYFLLKANEAQLQALARQTAVAWIEPFAPNEKHNQYGAGVIMGANNANDRGYDGSTQIAAVADTGLGGGTAETAHPDVPAGRIKAVQNFSAPDAGSCYDVIPDGAQDVDSGHGTHTTLSLLGDGGPGGIGRGTAPAAQLVFQAVEEYVNFIGTCALIYNDGYYLFGLPADYGNLFGPAYDEGARVHSNSWGSNQAGIYTQGSASADAFMWSHPDMLVTFSAGNYGEDSDDDGVVDDDSLGAPATAKNVLTVGASENDRPDGNFPCDSGLPYISHEGYQGGKSCAGMGGNNILGTWGQRYGTRFNDAPLASDLTAGNQEQMAAWSSRGPADDGRIKPDVVAPGTWVLSGYSNRYQEAYGAGVNPQHGFYQSDGWGLPLNKDYKYFGGTSMANPLAAGAAVVVRDFYQKTDGHAASAALVKATLINSAVDLLDENNDGVNDNDYPIPNVHEGWGRVNVDAATDGSHIYFDDPLALETTGLGVFPINVAEGEPIRVTLAWTDYPSTEAAAANLVNDLDLRLIAPGESAVYRGNVFAAGWSIPGGSADSVNNVENIYVQSPQAGQWKVEVYGANVPQGPQPYALVIDYLPTADISTPTPTATATTSPTPTATTTPTATATIEFIPPGDERAFVPLVRGVGN